MTKEELGRQLAVFMDRDYDTEGESAKQLAEWLLDNFTIRKKGEIKKKTKKFKKCPDSELLFPECRHCSDWYDRYQDDSISAEVSCFCMKQGCDPSPEMIAFKSKIDKIQQPCPYADNMW